MMRTITISFSGLNGTGKSTIIDMLEKHLQQKTSVTKVSLYHYGITQNKIMLRTAKYVKQNGLTNCTPRQYNMLMASMGIVLSYEAQAIPAMEEYRVILFDRYIDTFLFDFAGYEPVEKMLKTLPECDISFFLYCDVETAMKRVNARGREMCPDIEQFAYRCKAYFDDVLSKENEYTVINSARDVDEVFRDVADCVDRFMATLEEENLEK